MPGRSSVYWPGLRLRAPARQHGGRRVKVLRIAPGEADGDEVVVEDAFVP